MAKSKLHIICGTCGSNEDLKYEIEPQGICLDDKSGGLAELPSVYIKCGNCSTLHSLEDFLPMTDDYIEELEDEFNVELKGKFDVVKR